MTVSPHCAQVDRRSLNVFNVQGPIPPPSVKYNQSSSAGNTATIFCVMYRIIITLPCQMHGPI